MTAIKIMKGIEVRGRVEPWTDWVDLEDSGTLVSILIRSRSWRELVLVLPRINL